MSSNPMAHSVWQVWMAGVLALIALGAYLGQWLRARQATHSGRLHNQRGQRGEAQAERLLRAQGYRVLGRHVRGCYELALDGSPHEVDVIADLIVERAGARLVAEVKTGKWGRLGHADTRRQMLEYQLAFAVPAVLLIDVESGRISEVRFPWSEVPRRRGGATFPAFVLCGALILFAAWLLSQR